MWPWVSQIASGSTPSFLVASRMRSTSPPGSMMMARMLGSSHRMAQFCWNGVTGTMAARISDMFIPGHRKFDILALAAGDVFQREHHRPVADLLHGPPGGGSSDSRRERGQETAEG